MYDFDFSPILFMAGIGIGVLLGLVIDLVIWMFMPLGWWVFAVPTVSAFISTTFTMMWVR